MLEVTTLVVKSALWKDKTHFPKPFLLYSFFICDLCISWLWNPRSDLMLNTKDHIHICLHPCQIFPMHDYHISMSTRTIDFARTKLKLENIWCSCCSCHADICKKACLLKDLAWWQYQPPWIFVKNTNKKHISQELILGRGMKQSLERARHTYWKLRAFLPIYVSLIRP